jgi:hypothetical protein
MDIVGRAKHQKRSKMPTFHNRGCCCKRRTEGEETDFVPSTDDVSTDDVGCDCQNLEYCIIKLASLECGCSFIYSLLGECLNPKLPCEPDNAVYCEFICDEDPEKTYYHNSFFDGFGSRINQSSAYKPNGDACSEDCGIITSGEGTPIQTHLGPELGCYECDINGVVPDSGNIIFSENGSGCFVYSYTHLRYFFSENGCCPPEQDFFNFLEQENLNSTDDEILNFLENNENELCSCEECYNLIKNTLLGNLEDTNCPTVNCEDLISLLPNECLGVCVQNEIQTGQFKCGIECPENLNNDTGYYLFYKDMECGCPGGEWIIPGGICHKCGQNEIPYTQLSDGPCCKVLQEGFELKAVSEFFPSSGPNGEDVRIATCPTWPNPDFPDGNCCPTSSAWFLPEVCECWGQKLMQIVGTENWVPAIFIGGQWVPAEEDYCSSGHPCNVGRCVSPPLQWCPPNSQGCPIPPPQCIPLSPSDPIIDMPDDSCLCPEGYNPYSWGAFQTCVCDGGVVGNENNNPQPQ